MATTLANLRASVRIEIRDPDGYQFQDSDVDYALNQAYRTIFMRISGMNKDYFVTTDSINIVDGTRAYPLPADFLKAKLIEYVRDNTTAPLSQYARGASANYTGNTGLYSLSLPPFTYDFEGDNLVLEPTPSASLTDGLLVTYYATYTKLVADADEIHANFKDMFVDPVVLMAAMALNSQVEADGGIVGTSFAQRLDTCLKQLDSTVSIRTLSPKIRRKAGYFQ